MIGIYKITSPSGKIYIGQSVEISRRKSYYKNLKCNRQPKIYSSLKKYGWDKHKFEVLCECKREELNDLEVYYIELYQSFNSEFGLNLQAGGNVKTQSEETKLKISMANKGRPITEENKRKIGEANRNRIVSEETKEKHRNRMLGKPLSESHKKAAIEGRKRWVDNGGKIDMFGEKNPFFGKKHTDETRKHLSEIAKKRLVNPSRGR